VVESILSLLKKIEIQFHKCTDELDLENEKVFKSKTVIFNIIAIKLVAKDRKQKRY